jgi:accessory gene regulator protein AgrB
MMRRWVVNDESKPRKERRVKVGDIILIVVLLLMPGIRGYRNWMWFEYLFILIIIASIVYSWITGDRFWKKWEKKKATPPE